MNAPAAEPREMDEWRVEVKLEADEHGFSLGERLHSLDLDDEARERLGGSVIVTRDGPHLFLYAWHEPSASEAERVVRELMEEMGLAGEVQLTRWHPVADAWRPADEPLPQSELDAIAEEESHQKEGKRESRDAGAYPWEVVIDLPDRRSTLEFAKTVRHEGLPVKRRWEYLLVGADTEDAAMELGKRLEAEAPDGSKVEIRANPSEMPLPVFVQLGSLKPGFLRDLGI